MTTFHEFKERVQGVKQDKIVHGSFINQFGRFLSVRISWMLIQWVPFVRPNAVSVTNIVLILLVLIGPFFVGALPPYVVVVVQVLLLFCSSVLDKVDGELARAQSYFTQRGIYYDLLYHFLYTFSCYAFLGFFFGSLLPGAYLWYVAAITAFAVTVYKMFGKVRHHVRYKVLLEGHGSVIQDPVPPSSDDRSWFRFVEYFFYSPYEWTFLLFVLLVVLLPIIPVVVVWVYLVFTFIVLLLTLYRLLVWYPRHALFGEDDLRSGTLS